MTIVRIARPDTAAARSAPARRASPAATLSLAVGLALTLAGVLVAATPAAAGQAAAAAPPAAGADAIVGVWETAPTDKGYAHIEISRRGDRYFGKIVWLDEPLYPAGDEMAGRPKADRMNPDSDLRRRPIIGLEIVQGLEYAGKGRWDGGSIYDPESGKTYKSKAEIAAGGKVLKLRGYIGISLLGRTSEWKRVG